MNRLGYPFEEQRLGARLGLASGIRPIQWLLRVEFTTDDAAPLTNPYVGEVGSLTPVQVDGQLSASAGVLSFTAQSTPAWGDQGFYWGGVARLAGRALIAAFNYSTIAVNACFLGVWLSAQNLNESGFANVANGVYFASSGTFWGETGSGVNSGSNVISASTNYIIATVLRSAGAFIFIKGGSFANWTLLWVALRDNTATVYPAVSNNASAGTIDYFRVRDLPAPFTSDFGIAQNHITSFTQSAGSELLTNGNFAAWTADNPDSWTVTGESGADPMVTQVAPGGGAGTGAARLFASASNFLPEVRQSVLAANSWYEVGINITARVSGTVELNAGGVSKTHTTTGNRAYIIRAASALYRVVGGNAPNDFTVDDATAKLLTLNAQATMDANSVIDFAFTLPGSPVAGQTVQLRYRIVDDQNYWVAYVQRNDANSAWDFLVDSVSAGTRTNRLTAGTTGADTIRVICDGNLHDFYTKSGTTWTKRGSQVNNATHASATGLNTVYSTGTTPTSLDSYPRTATAYAELDRV